MDTVNLIQWHQEFTEIMESDIPEQLQLDKLRELYDRVSEQPDMYEEAD